MPYKVFVNGFPLNASELNQFLMQQSIATFLDSTARTEAIETPVEGQFTYLTGTNVLQYWDGSAWVTALPSELQYLTGVTSNIQTQLDGKQATITGAATTITGSNLTASRALTSNSSGKVAVSSVTDTELGFLSGVTSDIQTQLNAKQNIVAGVSDTEIGYLDGVTSAIQTQLNAKEDRSYTISNISANYTIQATDASRLIVSTGSAITVTIANVLTTGQRIDFLQDGTGQITFAAGSGVTLQSKNSLLKTAAQESAASIICIASGQYRLIGDLG